MAACRRRVVYLLLALLFLVDISFSSGKRNINDQQLPGDDDRSLPSNDVVKRFGGQRFDPGDAVRNDGGPGSNFVNLQNNDQFQKPFIQSAGNVGLGNGMNEGGVGPGVGGGNAFRVPANDHFPGAGVHDLGKIPVKPRKPSKIKISASEECAADVQNFCSKGVKDNNFSILDCLQSDERVILI